MELSDWLRCDYWSHHEAALLLSGVNPHGTAFQGGRTCEPERLFSGPVVFLDGTVLDPTRPSLPAIWTDEASKVLAPLVAAFEAECQRRRALGMEIVRLLNLIERSPLFPRAAPKAVAEWAVAKGMTPPWILPATDHAMAGEAASTESGNERRERLLARIKAERSKGTRPFLKVVAAEEGISVTRLKQLTAAPADPPSIWTELLPGTSKSVSTKGKGKH